MKAIQITTLAHAKINWTLDVFARRPDGYHSISSIMQCIELADRLTFTLVDRGVHLTVSGPESSGVPVDDSNIVVRAARLLNIDGVAIHIDKQIPSQAGLGGGSSDAAATITALSELFDLKLDTKNLLAAGEALGADVPFFLGGKAARIGGFGDEVQQLDRCGSVDLIIVKPTCGVSTGDAYAALDGIADRKSGDATAQWPAGGASNDFEEVVFALYPEVLKARQSLLSAGVHHAMLCGSGAAIMGWGGDLPAAAQTLREDGYAKVWVTRTIT